MANLTGNEITYVEGVTPNGMPAATLMRTTVNRLSQSEGGSVYTAIATNTPVTLTGAQTDGGQTVVLNMTAALAGAGTLNLPTVANLIAAIPGVYTGYSYNLRIINSSSGNFAWTVTTATGWTLNGTMTIAQNTFRDFVVNITSHPNATATLTTVGTGTYS